MASLAARLEMLDAAARTRVANWAGAAAELLEECCRPAAHRPGAAQEGEAAGALKA